ncbi:MAG: protein translocase SEC61 complex subunit gamma [Candidatus Micrarchaeota archaeon]
MNLPLLIKEQINSAIRVLRISHKPKESEFMYTVKITGLAMLLIGVIGLVITIIFGFL